MPKPFHTNFIALLQVILISTGIFCSKYGTTQISNDIEEYRFHVALKLFPRIAATDQHLKEKLTQNGKILLLIFYKNKRDKADQLKQMLRANIPRIGNQEIQYRYTNNLKTYKNPYNLPTAIFLAEPLNATELQDLVAYCQRHQRLVFSPFEGDVERGVTAGIYISNKITPYFNMGALSRSHIVLNEDLLRVATQYD